MNDISKLEKWEINKIGILNYWWYDEEEFKFEDGRMILRGTNGSGKSVTMTSFIPLLFDGKKTADRFDAFGNKARRLEDYVLGYGESIKEENTSYLYMEIYKPEIKRYLTVGMGLRAKKNQPLSFWGFIIKDGKRIGKDIYLYKDKNDKIPLTKAELAKKIGNSGQILSTQKEYMDAINKNVFGFSTLTEYEDYIKLLLEIRKSKLSGGNDAKPSVVTKILTNSLGALLDEDLRPVAESLDNMNKTKEQVEFLMKSKKSLDNIIKSYTIYNEAVLYSKTKNYIENEKYLKNIESDIINLEITIDKNLKSKEVKKKKEAELTAVIAANKYEIENLLKDERFNVEKIVIELKNELNVKMGEISLKNNKLEQLQNKLLIKESDIKKVTDKYEVGVYELNKLIDDALSSASEIDFVEFSYFAKDVMEQITSEIDFSGIKKNVKLYVTDLNKAKESLRKLSELESIYELTSNEIKSANDQLKIEKEKTLKILNDFSVNKQNYIKDFYSWLNSNKLFIIKDDDKNKITDMLELYKDKYSFDDISDILRKQYTEIESKFLTHKIHFDSKIEQLNVEKDLLNTELEAWKNNKEPEPIREKHICDNREKLINNKISFIPLYTAIDFKKDVDDNTKNIIESAFLDMGLLDAIVISISDIEKIKKVDSDFTDKYLFKEKRCNGESILKYLNVVLPNNSKIKAIEIENILSYIKLDYNENSNTTINKDGSYSIGLLKGKTSKLIDAKYIGYESKRRFKESKIKSIINEINLLDENILENNKLKNDILDSISNLKIEYNNCPQKNVLDDLFTDLESSRTVEVLMQNQIKDIELKISKLSDQCMEEKRNSKKYTDKYSFKVNYEYYSMMYSLANDFQNEILEVEKQYISTYHFYEIKCNYEDDKILIDDDVSELLEEIESHNKASYLIKEKIKSSEKIIDTDFENKKKMYESCLELEKTLPIEKENLIKEIAVFETQNEMSINKLIELNFKKEKIYNQYKLYKEIFDEEYNLKYVFTDDITAFEIIDSLNKFNTQGGILVKYSENLMNNFRENLEHLIEYNMIVADIFKVDDLNDVNVDLKEINFTRIRKDIFCTLKGKKVPILTLKKDIEDTIEQLNLTIEGEDRILFEEILTNTIGRKIIERIDYGNRWVKQMNNLLENLQTSSELTFSLKWRPKVADEDTQIDTIDLVNILKSDSKLLKDEDRISISKHFRNKFERATELYKEKDNIISFYNIMKETLDYRNWYEFELFYKQGLEQKKKLEDKSFYKFSGGEKAMAMYIPLFASIYAKYESANKDALRIISLDEAFAGVDDNNIRDMFKVLTNLRLNYVINSQILWGEYDTVPSLAINELVSSPQTQSISVIRYKWNGNYRELLLGNDDE